MLANTLSCGKHGPYLVALQTLWNLQILQASKWNVLLRLATPINTHTQQMCFWKSRCGACKIWYLFYQELGSRSPAHESGQTCGFSNHNIKWRYARWLSKLSHKKSCSLWKMRLPGGLHAEAVMCRHLSGLPQLIQTFKMPDMWEKPSKILQSSVSLIWTHLTPTSAGSTRKENHLAKTHTIVKI